MRSYLRLSSFFATLTAAAVLGSFVICFAADQPPSGTSGVPAKIEVSSATQVAATATLNNLQDAYNSESNTKEKYIAYAVKADQEGYKKAAALFRAAAKSVEIRAGFNAKILTGLGGKPSFTLISPVVKSTKENLDDAVKNEGNEAEILYPKFLEQAKAENIKGGMMAFGSGIKIKAGHKALFEEALKNLKSWKKASKGFFVCQVCGELVEKLDFAVCPICHAPTSEFALIK
jgi:rubrerythrin